MAEYFSRRTEKLDPGVASLEVFGVNILIDNPTGRLTYAIAHRMLGELGQFMIQGNVCTARFELWETRVGGVRHLGAGWLVPAYMATTAVD